MTGQAANVPRDSLDYISFARRNRLISLPVLLVVLGIEFVYFAWAFNWFWPGSHIWFKLGIGFALWVAFAILGWYLYTGGEGASCSGFIGVCLLNTIFLPWFLVEKVVSGEQINYDMPSGRDIRRGIERQRRQQRQQ